jgi:hypothetical protein
MWFAIWRDSLRDHANNGEQSPGQVLSQLVLRTKTGPDLHTTWIAQRLFFFFCLRDPGGQLALQGCRKPVKSW